MLGKLIKHEFIADSKVLAPSYIVVFVLSILGRFTIWVSTRKGVVDGAPITFRKALEIISSVLSILYSLSFVALIFITLFFLIYRFYKNFFTDEGYLMLTLPTEPRHLVFSKFLNSIIWTLFSLLVAGLSFYISMGQSEELQNTFKEFLTTLSKFIKIQGDFIQDQLGVSFEFFIFELVVFLLVLFSRFIISWYFAIAFGQLISKDHKVGGAIIAYLILEIVSKILSMLYMAFATKGMPNLIDSVAESAGAALQATMIGNGILCIVVSVVLYALICKIMTNKLNLD